VTDPEHPLTPQTLWRCFPWDPAAPPGTPFSPLYVPAGQTAGRFDLDDTPLVLYASESPVHAVAEHLQSFRNRAFRPGMLRRYGHPLSLVGFRLPALSTPAIDLCDPGTLQAHGVTPDQTAHHDRRVTQRIARALHTRPAGYPGLRWWSVFTGAWHMYVCFVDRTPTVRLEVTDPPRTLTATDPVVLEAREFLGMAIEA
jgi:hypothetical protein